MSTALQNFSSNRRKDAARRRVLSTVQTVHGKTCPKRAHEGDGYLHGAEDDRPYDVDGVYYCGRCHRAL